LILLAALISCDKHSPAPATQPTAPTIASLVPAATDLVIGMGARDRLLAVSTYDSDDKLPKAGDYETINWELLRSLHPSVLVTEIAADRQSAGFKSNCSDLHIQPVNVTIETLDDIYKTLDQLGDVLKEPQLASAAHQKMRSHLDEIQKRYANDKPIRTLIVITPAGDGVVGTGTFLDDLLKIAGGVNVVTPEMGHWPTIDREKLLSLKPDVILQLLPLASPQERDQAAATWKQLPQIPAVAPGRVYPIYDEYAMVPGWYVTDLAEKFAAALHAVKN
jgi:iron complex transport system substrate-binding protein